MLFAMLRLLPPRRGVDRLTADVHAGFQAVSYVGTRSDALVFSVSAPASNAATSVIVAGAELNTKIEPNETAHRGSRRQCRILARVHADPGD